MPLPRSVPVRPVIGGVALAAVAAGLVAVPGAQAVPTGTPVPIAAVPNTPWEIAPVPGGGTFIVERNGGIVRLNAQDQLQEGDAFPRSAIPGARKFLGLALAPDFATSRLAYLYVSIETAEDVPNQDEVNGRNGIWRLKEQDGTFTIVGDAPVFDGIDSDGNHDGGRMVFGPDGDLYVTTGDIHMPTRPQNPDSLNGKILRLQAPATGPLTAPADNPFVSRGGPARFVWSIGHRHPQGIAFDAAGRLWETEHGPTGENHVGYPGGTGRSGRDELNVIVKGGNYGWPVVSGPMTGDGFIPPAAVAGDSPAWAPGDVAVGSDGSIYAPFLAGARLQRFDVRQGAVFAQGQHLTSMGRLRVAVSRGSELLVAEDGGGTNANDPNIYKVALSAPTPGGSDAADVASPSKPPPTTPGPGTTPGTTPTPAAPSAAQIRFRTRALVRKLRTAAGKLGRRRLEAGRTIVVRATGPSVGRTTIELRLRSSRGTLLARVKPRTTSTAPQRYTVKLGATGRKRLRATSGRRIVLRVSHRPASGATVTTAVGLTVAKRR